jgi:hypothetical protein
MQACRKCGSYVDDGVMVCPYCGYKAVDISEKEDNMGIIDKIKFVQEGHFTEKEGAGLPTLRLIGDVQGVDAESMVVRPDSLYPLTTSDLQERLNLNSYQIQAVLHFLKVKEKPKYHACIMHGGKKRIPIHKYSENLVDVLKRYLEIDGRFQECIQHYKEFCQERAKSKPRKKRR